MHIAAKWMTFLAATGLVFYFYKYEFGPRKYPTPTLDRRSFYKPSAVAGILDELGNSRAAYLEQETTIDLIFPMIYGLMFVSAIVGLTPGAGAPRWVVVLPLLAVAGDYAENATAIAMLKRYAAWRGPLPVDLGVLPWIATAASGTKGASIIASILAVTVLAIAWVVRR
ncbi:MAG: hypothetical protein QOC81_3938 [Thermoanaerobaculia bacterium]|jgi:hypothetical protein|nr:hypothetical protein [Thermoanaerobaculia bacterium]